jgi:hypothetical protein
MPTPVTPGPRGFTRRDGLLAIALLGPMTMLVACTQDAEPDATGSSASDSAPGTTVEAGSAEAVDEARLIARYDAVLSAPDAVPAAALALLTSIRDQHIAHRDALGGASPAPAPADPAGTWQAALADLVDAERVASKSRIRACVESADPETARLLTLIGASEAAHVPALRELSA